MVTIQATKFRTNEEIHDTVHRNFFVLADFVVGKLGPIKSYKEFGDLCGQQNLSEIANGKRPLPMQTAIRACDVTGCSYNWMFRNEGEMFGKDDVMKRLLVLEERISTVEKSLGIRKKGK